jgi:hypothetical protein
VLTEEELATEDAIDRRHQSEPITNAVVTRFVAEEIDIWDATMSEMAEMLDTDVESVRAALVVLATEADFSVKPDPANADMSDVLSVRVDWKVFDEERIFLGGQPEGWTLPANMFALVGSQDAQRRIRSFLDDPTPWAILEGSEDDDMVIYRLTRSGT